MKRTPLRRKARLRPRRKSAAERQRTPLRARSRKGSADARYAAKVANVVLRRDGGRCRLPGFAGVPCSGRVGVAHLQGKRRAQTRGLIPECRHDPSWELTLCVSHHALEEHRIIDVLWDEARGPYLAKSVSGWRNL